MAASEDVVGAGDLPPVEPGVVWSNGPHADAFNEPMDPRSPDADAEIVTRGEDVPAEGRDETAADASESLPPGADLRRRGPRGDVDRAQPYDEQPIGLRMQEQPFEPLADSD